MIELFDSHMHVCDGVEPEQMDAWLEPAEAAGVVRMVAVGGSCDLNNSAAKAAEYKPDRIRATIGFDRDQVEELGSKVAVDDACKRLRRMVQSLPELGVKICGLGEIGLDYHYSPESREAQMMLFRAQCELAVDLGLPVVVHSREADEDTLAIIRSYGGALKGVLHCFTGSAEFAAALMDQGFCLSFSGIVTFRNADALRTVAREVPDERILIETDSPYLAPVPHRGERNEPAFVIEVARLLADLRGIALEDFAAITTANGCRLFGWH